jgi:hypothetical protein
MLISEREREKERKREREKERKRERERERESMVYLGTAALVPNAWLLTSCRAHARLCG